MNGSASNNYNDKREDEYDRSYKVNEPKVREQYEGEHEEFEKSSEMNESASNKYN